MLISLVAFSQLISLLFIPFTRQVGLLFLRALGHGYLKYALIAPFLLVGGIYLNRKLASLKNPILEWSPLHNRSNVALMPLRARGLWPIYYLVLLGCIPVLAFFEEWIFRNGDHNLPRDLLLGGLAFGFVHLVSLVTIRMCCYLTLVGLVLVGVYSIGGLTACFVVHATYNVLALTMATCDSHLPKTSALMKPLRRLAENTSAALTA